MDGLYATLPPDGVLEMCQFPYGNRQCERALALLRQHDPPLFDDIAPDKPIARIRVADRPLAYHFLMRAAAAMCYRAPERATPYFMAFSQLSRVRFSLIRVIKAMPTIGIEVQPLEDMHIETARQLLKGMAATDGMIH